MDASMALLHPENNDAPNGSANAITTLAGAMLRAERQRVKLGT